jgi:histidine ammonia-lyase
MSMHAALKAERALLLATHVIAVEVLCACQALDFHAPLTTSAPLARVHAAVRAHVPTLVDDRPPSSDLARIVQLITSGSFEYASGAVVN